MWRIFNILFGWNYIYAECGYVKKACVTRVRKFGGKYYYKNGGRFELIKKHKYESDSRCFPLSMNQEEFDMMVKANEETEKS